MTSKAQRKQALIEATASLRLEGLPILQRDDDIYAAAIDGSHRGSLRDAVLARIRAEPVLNYIVATAPAEARKSVSTNFPKAKHPADS
ncbi:hypothetical protein [Stenotrophomonas forensis]|nr:hypothetical protein [Stenotrophomonas maltophilia]HEL3779244.1 hypothetical protein [Stenotrophomonas maltophilia]HEL5007034.1 hypothetical protein [Stenotrophomonas maltophilia]